MMCRELQLTNLLRKWRLPLIVDQSKLRMRNDLSSIRSLQDCPEKGTTAVLSIPFSVASQPPVGATGCPKDPLRAETSGELGTDHLRLTTISR